MPRDQRITAGNMRAILYKSDSLIFPETGVRQRAKIVVQQAFWNVVWRLLHSLSRIVDVLVQQLLQLLRVIPPVVSLAIVYRAN